MKPKPNDTAKQKQITIGTHQDISPFKNTEKSTPVIECLKTGKVPKFTVCDKQLQTFIILSVKNLLQTLPLYASNHRLNGSSSPVLTVTPRSYGKGQISIPYKMKTLIIYKDVPWFCL